MGIFSSKLEKRALDWVPRPGRHSLFGGLSTSSGSDVDQESVMSLPSVWAGVNFYATVLGSLPMPLYERTKSGKEKATNRLIYDVLENVANPEMVSMVYRENCTSSVMLMGRSYSEKNYNGRGEVSQLWPIPAYMVEVKRLDGRKIYKISMPSGGTKYLDREKVLEIIGPFGGSSIIGLLKESFGLSLSLNEYAARFFGSGTHPGVVVEREDSLGPDTHAKLQNSLIDKHSGLGQSHRLMLLDEGMKISKIGHTPEQSQAIQSRGFQISEVARILNLAPHILKDLTKSTNNNIEQQSLETVIYSLQPMAVRIEKHLNAQLLSTEERKKYFFKHNLAGLLRGDSKARSEFYWKMFQMGVYSINDILQLEDRNTIGPDGDKRFTLSTMAPIDKIDNLYAGRAKEIIEEIFENRVLPKIEEKRADEPGEPNIKGRDSLNERMKPLFKKDIQRVVNKEAKAVKKSFIGKSNEDFRKWLKGFYKKFPDYVVDNVGDTFRAFSLSMKDVILGEVGKKEADIDSDIDSFIAGFAKRYSEDSEGQIEKLLDEDPEGIETRTDEWTENKADKQAFRQTRSLTGMVASSVTFVVGYNLMWSARGTACPYCKQLDGKIIASKEEYFIDGGEVLKGDKKDMTVRNRTKFPQLHNGCDCDVIAV